jgi:hypothetical protein
LTASDLAELVRRYGRATDAANIRGILRSSLGRSVRESEDSSRGDGREPVQAFSHESLLTAAKSRFADDQAQYLGLLDSWADSYQDRGWSAGVPPYLLTPYLRHLVIRSLEPTAPEAASTARDRLLGVCSDPGWLCRAIHDTGVDAAIDALDGARRALPAAWLDAITRSLRRSRVALAGDPDQLATQLHARLAREPDSNLRGYVSRLPAIAPRPWVRLRSAALGWRADLETMFTYDAKVRAVAFGQVESRVTLAVGAGDQIVVRDLQRGASAEWVINNDGLRVTAVAMGTIEGRPVVVAVAWYDETVTVRDIGTAELVGAAIEGGAFTVAIGTLEGRTTVAGVDRGRLLLWDVASGQPLERAVPTFTDRPVVGVGTVQGRVVAHLMELGDRDSPQLITIDLDHGGEVASPVALSCPPDLVASWADPDGIAIITSDETWQIADLATASGPLRAIRPVGGGDRVRAVAIARVADRYVATAAPDNDLDVGFVAISELTTRTDLPAEPAERVRTGPIPRPDIEAVLVGDDDAVQLLTADPVVLIDAETSDVVDPHPKPQLVAAALTGQASGDFIDQATDGTIHFRDAPATTNPGSQAGSPPQVQQPALISSLEELDDQPGSWPTLTRAFGVIQGNAVIARGSYNGTVWVQSLASGDLVAGPFVDLPPTTTIPHGKPPPEQVTSVAIGEFGGRGLLAAAFQLRAWVAKLDDTASTPMVIPATSVTAVALGRIADQNVVVTGSRGGFIGIWRADTAEQIAGVTLDSGVERVWVIHGTKAIAARTDDQALVIADIVQ